MAYWLLGGAILTEVIATLSLRASEGLTRFGFAAVVIVGYVLSFVLLAQALTRGMPLGSAYAIWAAVGVATVAAVSVPVFGESISAVQAGGIVLIIAGVVAVELGSAH